LGEEWSLGVQKSERLHLLSQVELENMFLILVSLRKIASLSDLLTLSGVEIKLLRCLESKIDILISDLDVLPFGHSRRV
jgi:hypothetical protein